MNALSCKYKGEERVIKEIIQDLQYKYRYTHKYKFKIVSLVRHKCVKVFIYKSTISSYSITNH